MRLHTALRLGRVSNLPTVWTNVFVGIGFAGVFAGGYTGDLWRVVGACLIYSLFYLCGMFLNDVFDAQWDEEHKISRPITDGETTPLEASVYALVFVVIAFVLVYFLAVAPLFALCVAGALLGMILVYDWRHKQWTFSPWIMGACRLLVYLGAFALVVSWELDWKLLGAGFCLLAYVAGITYLARSEHLDRLESYLPFVLLFSPLLFCLYLGYNNFLCLLSLVLSLAWLSFSIRQMKSSQAGSISRGVGYLLAGITLIDASLLFSQEIWYMGVLALVLFIFCLLMQKKFAAS